MFYGGYHHRYLDFTLTKSPFSPYRYLDTPSFESGLILPRSKLSLEEIHLSSEQPLASSYLVKWGLNEEKMCFRQKFLTEGGVFHQDDNWYILTCRSSPSYLVLESQPIDNLYFSCPKVFIEPDETAPNNKIVLRFCFTRDRGNVGYFYQTTRLYLPLYSSLIFDLLG